MTAAAEPLRTVAVVGAGPRGTAIIERLVAASHSPDWRGGLTVHLIDPLVGRGGAVWRHDQSAVLLMNTTTCQTTMYPDESCHALLPAPRTQTLADHLAGEGLAPTDFASRAAHGRYLAHVLETARRSAPAHRSSPTPPNVMGWSTSGPRTRSRWTTPLCWGGRPSRSRAWA
ncbi:MAG: FAD/NAD(P)-binding protein [Brachybacterium sp.]|nr:FAD/NAD(P)-binding protein [Brachybacterium sp.]